MLSPRIRDQLVHRDAVIYALTGEEAAAAAAA